MQRQGKRSHAAAHYIRRNNKVGVRAKVVHSSHERSVVEGFAALVGRPRTIVERVPKAFRSKNTPRRY